MDVHAHLAGAYERAAPTYDRAAFSHHAELGERLAQRVLLGPGGRVLDVGCGAGAGLRSSPLPGGWGRGARRSGSTSPRGWSRARARRRPGSSRCAPRWMDGASLDFEDEHFDAVLCAFTIAAIPDAAGALAEMRLRAPATGTIGVERMSGERVDDEWVWEGELMGELAGQAPPELLETVGRLSGRFAGAPRLHAALANAGFREIKMDREYVEPHVPERGGVVGVVHVRRRAGVRRVAPGGGAARVPRTRDGAPGVREPQRPHAALRGAPGDGGGFHARPPAPRWARGAERRGSRRASAGSE